MGLNKGIWIFAFIAVLLLGCVSNPQVENNTREAVYARIVDQIEQSESLPHLFEASAYTSVAYNLWLESGGITPDVQAVLSRAKESFDTFQTHVNKNITFAGPCYSTPDFVEHKISRAVSVDVPSSDNTTIIITVITGFDTSFEPSKPLIKEYLRGWQQCSELVAAAKQPMGRIDSIATENNAPIYSLVRKEWFQPYADLFK